MSTPLHSTVQQPSTIEDTATGAPAAVKRGGRKSPKASGPQSNTDKGLSAEPIATSQEMLKLTDIIVDTDIQSRAGLNQQAVEDYAERLQAGDPFPPLTVFDVGGTLLLADGFHTHQAALEAGLHEMPAIVHRGSRKDAIRYSLQSNTSHGLPRSNADKQRAARLALQEFPELSDGAIAELIKVSQPFVSSTRRELKSVLGSEARVGRDGKKRKPPQRATAKEESATDQEVSDAADGVKK